MYDGLVGCSSVMGETFRCLLYALSVEASFSMALAADSLKFQSFFFRSHDGRVHSERHI